MTTPSPTSVGEATSKLTALGVPYTTDIAKKLSNYYADKWEVSRNVMWSVIICENKKLDPDQQSTYRYTRDSKKWGVKAGQQEKSYGLVQIHLPDNPDITYEQATDPDFSLNFLAEGLSKGQGNKWTCYRSIKA